jgi:hypothetical protein
MKSKIDIRKLLAKTAKKGTKPSGTIDSGLKGLGIRIV